MFADRDKNLDGDLDGLLAVDVNVLEILGGFAILLDLLNF